MNVLIFVLVALTGVGVVSRLRSYANPPMPHRHLSAGVRVPGVTGAILEAGKARRDAAQQAQHAQAQFATPAPVAAAFEPAYYVHPSVKRMLQAQDEQARKS